jgi:hypothetical protein
MSFAIDMLSELVDFLAFHFCMATDGSKKYSNK